MGGAFDVRAGDRLDPRHTAEILIEHPGLAKRTTAAALAHPPTEL